MGIIAFEVEIPSTRPAPLTSWNLLTGLPIDQLCHSDSSPKCNVSEDTGLCCFNDSARSPRASMSALLSGPLSHLLYSRCSITNDGQSGGTVWFGAPTTSDVQSTLGFPALN